MTSDVASQTVRLAGARAGRSARTVLAVQVARSAVRSGALWGLVFAVFVGTQSFAYVAAYRTQAARDQLAHAFGSNVGINALIGPARAIDTVAGFSSWRALGILGLLGGVWGLLTATRLLRGEEEAGRRELLLAGQTTRHGAGLQSLAGLAAGWGALFTLTALGTVSSGQARSIGFSVGQSLYFALTLACGAAVFLALGALASQLAATRRQAAAICGAVFGVSYALRMLADSDPALHALVWLSPFGWIEQSRPLTGPQPWALLPVLVLVLAAAVVTVRLAGTRDLGAASLPERDSRPPRLRLLRGPATLAVRLMRPAALGWLFAVCAFSLLVGTVAQSASSAISASNPIARAIERLGGHASLVATYLGLIFLMVAILIALIGAGQIAAIRDEEAGDRLELLLVRPVSRPRWFSTRLSLSAALVLVAGILAGGCAWVGAASQHSGLGFGSLIAAGLNIVPPAIFLLGLGALVFGAAPRRVATVVYGYLAWSFLIEFIGAVVHANHWILDTSVFFHMAPAPAVPPHWASAVLLASAGLLSSALGGLLFLRRDVVGQ